MTSWLLWKRPHPSPTSQCPRRQPLMTCLRGDWSPRRWGRSHSSGGPRCHNFKDRKQRGRNKGTSVSVTATCLTDTCTLNMNSLVEGSPAYLDALGCQQAAVAMVTEEDQFLTLSRETLQTSVSPNGEPDDLQTHHRRAG